MENRIEISHLNEEEMIKAGVENMLYIPYKNFMKKRWEINFPNRNKEFGDISYIISEYLSDGLIYEYSCDGKRCHEHSFNAILENIVKDITYGHQVDIKGFEDEYSTQELNIINKLIDKLTKDILKYNINNIINDINNKTRKPVFEIDIKEDNLTIFDSKIGGKPFWKKDLDYPEINERRMILLAQINFSDLPKNDIFPDKGMLQFFILPNEMYGVENEYKVIYHTDLDNAIEIESPHFEYYQDTPVLKEGKLFFNLANESISYVNYDFYKYKKLFSKDLEDIIDDIIYDRINNGCGSKLLGYPFFTQYDPRENTKKDPTKYDTLLFQLDSDYEFIHWGDSGVGNFFINSKDLEQLKFDDVLYSWDCC